MQLFRSDQHRIQATFDGIALPVNFVWDSAQGGDIAADNAYYHAGNMAPAVPSGGLRTPTDMTITVAWSDQIYPYYVSLWKAAGFTPATVTITPLGMTPGQAATGSGLKPITWSGLLLSVTRPQSEAASSSIGYLSCVIAPTDPSQN